MRTFLPLFPLEIVVFPGERLKLHIFEPRYKQLIRECRDEGITFGIPAYLKDGIAEYGTEMRLLEILKTFDDGEMDILTEATQAFHLESFVRHAEDKPYAGGEVTLLENDPETDPADHERLLRLYNRLHAVLKTGAEITEADSENLSFVLAENAALSLAQRVHLLSMPRERDRAQYLMAHFEQVIPIVETTEETRVKSQGNGHPKHFPRLDF